jgi:DNA/RNA-binding domain of Phe-tRNA-synthetase-like protein
MRFTYDDAIAARFPAVAGGAIHATGITNGPSPDALRAAFATEQAATLTRLGARPLSEVPSLAAWRRAFRAFGVDPTAYRSAAEALLRRLTKQGEIPSINTLVDIGNLVSIRYGLPVAIMDQARMTGGTTVRFATGDEAFTDLGSGATETTDPGEVIFVDEAGLVSARRWCWRQAGESAARSDTTEILVTVEAQHDGGADAVAAALADIERLLRAYASAATLVTGTVDALHRSFAGLSEG